MTLAISVFTPAMTSGIKNWCEVSFTCGHDSLSGRVAFERTVPAGYQPPDMGPFYCLMHGPTMIDKVHAKEWRVRCHGTHVDGSDYDCRFSRWCGQSRAKAMRYAKSHCSWKNQDHHVFVAYDTVTRDGKGIILASGARWPVDYLVSQTRNVDQLPIFTVAATLKASTQSDVPPPF
jgi:hypothetical protein